ncbi:MAG: alpha/beta hydrolase, partial [Novosphingobium sp.]|nr:alpha/beta hydrolase [Novosphingobium sp.]
MTRWLVLLAALFLPLAAQAQEAAPSPEQALAISLGTGPVPGALGPEMWSGKPGDLSVRNTVEATLLPVLPERANATGEAAIIAPGGAFYTLSYDHEGTRVAHALAERGIAAFVLKYRVRPTPRQMPEFGKVMVKQ